MTARTVSYNVIPAAEGWTLVLLASDLTKAWEYPIVAWGIETWVNDKLDTTSWWTTPITACGAHECSGRRLLRRPDGVVQEVEGCDWENLDEALAELRANRRLAAE